MIAFNGATHRLIGLMAAYGFKVISFSDPWASIGNAIIVYISSTLPDWDLRLGIRHRGFTHSLLCMAGLSALVIYAFPPAALPFIIGYASHLFADSFTVTGIEAFWPWHEKVGARIFRTGKKRHRVVRYH